MIEKLERGDVMYERTMQLAVTLSDKINELVEAVNRMEKQIEKLQVI